MPSLACYFARVFNVQLDDVFQSLESEGETP